MPKFVTFDAPSLGPTTGHLVTPGITQALRLGQLVRARHDEFIEQATLWWSGSQRCTLWLNGIISRWASTQ